MRKTIVRGALLPLLFHVFLNTAGAQGTVLPLDQVKRGMTGTGKTVFSGNSIEEFEVEILGVMRNYQPERNIILARLKNAMIDNAGVIQGMSGSPVYIDGKVIGAVAYSWSFAKEAIAGITPIEEMLRIGESQPSSFSSLSRQPIQKTLTLNDLAEIYAGVLPDYSGQRSEGRTLVPLSVPLVFSGFTERGFAQAKSVFSRLGFFPVSSGGSSQTSENLTIAELSLREGDAVGAQLILGDLNMTAVGTVTRVDGNKILAFGHPLYNLGKISIPMSRENVVAVMPSLDTSFKITSTLNTVGMFSEDRNSGIMGTLGKKARMIPVNVKMRQENGSEKVYRMEVVPDKILTPFLVNVAVTNAVTVAERALGDLSLALSGDVFLENGQSVHVEDLFSGNFDSSTIDLAGLVTAVVFYLSNNEFKDLGIHRIDLDINAIEEVRYSYLDKVLLDKYDVLPGEIFNVRVFTRDFRNEGVVHEGPIQAPNLPSGSVCYLVVADSQSLQQIESTQYRTQGFVPRSFSQLIRLLSSLRKNNRIYFKIIASKPGLFLQGEEMPNLPPTMKSMFSSSRVATAAPTEMDRSTLLYRQLVVPNVFRGAAVIPIKIK